MPKTIHKTDYHLAFNTKYRKKVLVRDIAQNAKEIIENIASRNNCTVRELKVMPNHVHLLISIPPKVKISEIAQKLKGTSSYRLFREFPDLRKKLRKGHLWVPSYFVRATGNVTIGTVKRYIEKQARKQG